MREKLQARTFAFLAGDVDRISATKFAEDCFQLGQRETRCFKPRLMTMAEAERELILWTINFFNGKRTKAAKALGIGKSTINRKMREYCDARQPNS